MKRVEAWLVSRGAHLVVNSPSWEQRVVGLSLLHTGCWFMRIRYRLMGTLD